MGLKLIDVTSPRAMQWWKPGVRDWAHYLDMLAFWLGFLLPIVDAKRQTIADKTSRTVVISRKETGPAPMPAGLRSAAAMQKSEPV